MLTLQALMYIEGNDGTSKHIWNYVHSNPDILERVLNRIVLSNSRTWENFNNQGRKIILLSDKLWLIANNSKGFTNGSKVDDKKSRFV